MSLTTLNEFIDINDHGLLLVKGPDATKFLQGQVTCDIEALSFSPEKSQTSLGGHCNHKGRMLFSFRACRLDDDTIALAMHSELISNALDALKKYSVFSKVELIDARDDYQLLGFNNDDTASIETLIPSLPDTPDYATHYSGVTAIRINNSRYECWIHKQTAAALLEKIQITDNANAWTALNIADGIGEVRLETIEEFIPQMLNYQLIGHGISFKKGCYTGQEVVARMHYLGKLKRHMYRFAVTPSESAPSLPKIVPGTPLFAPDSKQPIGHTVISADVDGTQELLAVATEEAVTHDKVHIGDDCQYKLEALPLPYAITKE